METFAVDLRTMVRTPLTEAHVEAIRKIAAEQVFEPGDMVQEVDAPLATFNYIVEVRSKRFSPRRGNGMVKRGRGRRSFLARSIFSMAGHSIRSARASKRSVLLCVPREDMLRLMSETPEMSDIIIMVFAARRRRMLEAERTGLVLIGGEEDWDVRRIASYASRKRIPTRELTLGSDDARALAVACGVPADAPAVILNGNQAIYSPTPRGVARALELDMTLHCGDVMDVVIVDGSPPGVGSGVCVGTEGLTAMYLARTVKNVHVLVRGKGLAASMSDYLLSRRLCRGRCSGVIGEMGGQRGWAKGRW